MIDFLSQFYKGKNVLITGHTGFKGSWLAIWLLELGANVIGYALEPYGIRDNFVLSELNKKMTHIIGDVRDENQLKRTYRTYKPDIVFHLAAQPIVRQSYGTPKYTYEVNVMGTLNVLEGIKETPETKIGIMVTSDKCYKNKEWIFGYKEDDELGGKDPYSASKGCAELLIASYRDSFFNSYQFEQHGKIIASARAGNVIGGGDWAVDRIVPDCIRALEKKEAIYIRKPHAIRPWQHVIEPIYGYLLLAAKSQEDAHLYSGPWNFGPDFGNIVPVKTLADKVSDNWGGQNSIISKEESKLHEAELLNLDATKAKYYLKWKPLWDMDKTIEKTVAWYKHYDVEDVYGLCLKQINEYYKDMVI